MAKEVIIDGIKYIPAPPTPSNDIQEGKADTVRYEAFIYGEGWKDISKRFYNEMLPKSPEMVREVKLPPQEVKEDTKVFVTEDGVKIEKAVDFYFLNPYNFTYWKADHNRLFTNDFWLTFSTEDACKEWVLNNKPCLSLNDLLEVWATDALNIGRDFSNAPLYKNFEQKAKQKLNQ